VTRKGHILKVIHHEAALDQGQSLMSSVTLIWFRQVVI